MPLKLHFVLSRYLDPFPRYDDSKCPLVNTLRVERPTDLNIFPGNAISRNRVYRLFGIGQ